MRFALRVTNAPLDYPIWIECFHPDYLDNPFKTSYPSQATLLTTMQALNIKNLLQDDELELVNEEELQVYILMSS